MINRKIVYLLAILAVVIGLSLWDREHTKDIMPTETVIHQPNSNSDAPPTPVKSALPEAEMTTQSPTTSPSNGTDPIESLKIPELDALRAEVKKDPHSTPPILLKFAGQMADAMEEAKEDEQKGSALFRKLETCVENEGPAAARALCLENAQRLATLYPKLEGSFDDLKNRAPPNVSKLLENPKF